MNLAVFTEIIGIFILPFFHDQEGQLLRLGDVAQIERRAKPNQVAISYQGKPAIELAAAAGKAILCTKPLALHGQEALEILRIVEDAHPLRVLVSRHALQAL